MPVQTLPRDSNLAEEARDLTARIRLFENHDGSDERVERFLAWARERLKEIAALRSPVGKQ